ncbi:MAG: hypothetical protein DRN81_06555 [Thermoproteota archaeon]|nr:MAG: hypothetical protein DRN81_06555 [Candidatus Korarchaeota archaeon]
MSVHSQYRVGLWHPYEKPIYGVLLNPYHPLARGLVGCWLFNEGGGNTVFDLSRHANHGMLGGGTAGYCPSWIVGRFGSALSFDGTDDYIDCGNIGKVSKTICARVKFTDSTSTRGIVESHMSSPSSFHILATGFSGGRFATIPGSVENDGVETVNTYNDGKWHFVVALRDTNEIYVDGVKVSTQPDHNNYGIDSDVTKIGVRAGNRFFNGVIGEVRIYNRALNAEEIWQLYTDPFCMFYHPLEAEVLYAAAPPAGIVPQVMHHYRMLREV